MDQGSLVRRVRQSSGQSIENLAKSIGVQVETVIGWERGAELSPEHRKRLVEHLEALQPTATRGEHRRPRRPGHFFARFGHRSAGRH